MSTFTMNDCFKEVAEVKCKKDLEGCYKVGTIFKAFSHVDYKCELDIEDEGGNLHTIATSVTQDWKADKWFDEYFEIVKLL